MEPPRQGINKGDYIAPPSSSRGPVRVLGRKSSTTTTAKPATTDDRKKPAQRREPVINVNYYPRCPAGTQPQRLRPRATNRPRKARDTPYARTAGWHEQRWGAPEAPTQNQGAAARRPKPAPLPTPGDGPVPGRGPAAPGKGGLTQFTDKAKGKKGKRAKKKKKEFAKACRVSPLRVMNASVADPS